MKLSGPARRLSIFVGESDQYRHGPLYHEIVARAMKAGLAGASVFRGIEGFGASSRIHTTRILSLSEDLPLVIIIVDTAEKIEAFLPQLDALIAEGLVIIDDVDVIKYVGRGPKPSAEQTQLAESTGDGTGHGTGDGESAASADSGDSDASHESAKPVGPAPRHHRWSRP
jgi:uncharacterized protein